MKYQSEALQSRRDNITLVVACAATLVWFAVNFSMVRYLGGSDGTAIVLGAITGAILGSITSWFVGNLLDFFALALGVKPEVEDNQQD